MDTGEEKFKKAIDDYFSSEKKLEFLDSVIPENKHIQTIDGKNHHCFKEGYKHEFHTDHKQLNYLSDAIKTISNNIEVIYHRQNLLSNILLKRFININDTIVSSEEMIIKQIEEFSKNLRRTEELLVSLETVSLKS